VEYLLQLFAGGHLSHGLIQDTENQIAAGIHKIEGLSLRNIPCRDQWLTWYNDPNPIPLTMNTRLSSLWRELEGLVIDGEELHAMVEAR
jgi:hypothetical protein